MANPLSGLTPALEVLVQNVDILPATGQAVEDLIRPDQEEIKDMILTQDDMRVDMLIGHPNRATYVSTPPLPRTEQNVFRYFLDGSQRSYFLGTAVERERSTPIMLAQVVGRSGSAELAAPAYRFINQDVRGNLTRLSKGELLLSHSIYRQLAKIIFPKPAFKQQE